ncbi:MAG: 2-oxoglutarate dehydrogenase E1 subunit family protein, partial [bacterium]
MAHTGANKDGSHPHAPQSVNSWQPDYVEALFAQFKADPDSVGPEWKNFFLG